MMILSFRDKAEKYFYSVIGPPQAQLLQFYCYQTENCFIFLYICIFWSDRKKCILIVRTVVHVIFLLIEYILLDLVRVFLLSRNFFKEYNYWSFGIFVFWQLQTFSRFIFSLYLLALNLPRRTFMNPPSQSVSEDSFTFTENIN